MYCFQCQEALNNKACVSAGVCGKPGTVSDLQDLLLYTAKGAAQLAAVAKVDAEKKREAGIYVMEALFTTVTNVSFSDERILDSIRKGEKLKRELRATAAEDVLKRMPKSASWDSGDTEAGIRLALGAAGILSEKDEDIRSLKEFAVYGLKGMAAYAHHAYILGFEDPEVSGFFLEALAKLSSDMDTAAALELIMKTGAMSVTTLALLDRANTTVYGKPEITTVATGTVKGKAILVSGHDLKDLSELLEQTKDKVINIYTHGEMLPANAYPALKKYKHLKGNYGTSWWAQWEEFSAFNGAVLMTTNCLQKPREVYMDRIFTTGLVSFDGVKHIADRQAGSQKDFSAVIKKALELESVKDDIGKSLTIGFGHDAVLAIANKVVDAVKSGAIKQFIVMAGCDGRQPEREYYTDRAKNLPEGAVILTAGCAKYRYNALELGDIGGIPRVIDAGQCNDSYSLAVIALKLKEVTGAADINDLPIVFDIAWYEQKAVTVLLALLSLGFKNIQVGPTLPAFLSQNVAGILVEKFGLKVPDLQTAEKA